MRERTLALALLPPLLGATDERCLVWVDHTTQYGYAGLMKITVEVSDAILERARRVAQHRGRSVRSLVEEGLRLVLETAEPARPYRMEDRRVGVKGGPNPLESMSWQDLRAEIYGGR